MEERISFRGGKLVAGSFSDEEFQSEIDKINQAIGRYVDSYFDAKIAKYRDWN